MAEARHRVFVLNLMTKAGESDNFRASTFVERVLDYLQPARLDAVLANTQHPPRNVLQRCAREGSQPVEVDAEVITSLGIHVIAGPLGSARRLVGHDPVILADAILEYLRDHDDGPASEAVLRLAQGPSTGTGLGQPHLNRGPTPAQSLANYLSTWHAAT